MRKSSRVLTAALLAFFFSLSGFCQSAAESRFLNELDSTFRYFETRWDQANGWFYELIPTIASRQASGWASSTHPGSSVANAFDAVDDFHSSSKPASTAWQGAGNNSQWEYRLDVLTSRSMLLGLVYLTFTAEGIWDVRLERSINGNDWIPVTSERFIGRADTDHYAVLRFWRSQGLEGRYWRVLIETTATPGQGVRPQIWDIALYTGTPRPLTMPSAQYAMAVAVKHIYGRATPQEIVRAQRICANLMNTPPQVGITFYVTFDGSETYQHPLFVTSIMEGLAVCYKYLPLDPVTRSKIYTKSEQIYWASYNLNGHSEKYIWAPGIAYWLYQIRNDYWYPRHYMNAIKMHLDMAYTGGVDSTFTQDFKHRYEKQPDELHAFNWGMQEYWHNLYALSFYDSMVAGGGSPFNATQLARYRAWQQAVLGNYAFCGLSNIDSVWGVARGHSGQYIEWAAKGLLGIIKGATLNQFPNDHRIARALLDNYIDHRHIMDTWDGDEEDGALPLMPLQTRARSYELHHEWYNLNKLTAAGIYLSTISLALLQGVPDIPSQQPTGLARWFWNRKQLLVNTDYYSAGIMGTRRVPNGPTSFDYVGVHPSRIMDQFYRPLINYRGGTHQPELPGFDFRLKAGGHVYATTRADFPNQLDIVHSPWNLAGIGDYDTRPLDPRFASLIVHGSVSAGAFTNTARIGFFRRVIRDDRAIIRTGSAPSSAEAYMPFVLNKGMVSQVWTTSDELRTMYDGVMGPPSPIALSDVRYIHHFYPPSPSMPGSGLCIIPIHNEIQGYTGAAPKLELGQFASNYSHNGTIMTQETSRNVLRVKVLDQEAVPTELRWRAFYAITDGTDEAAKRAYDFYTSITWRGAFDQNGEPVVAGAERQYYSGTVLGGQLLNTTGWSPSAWRIEMVTGQYLDITYTDPNSIRLRAPSTTVATVQRKGLPPALPYAFRVMDGSSGQPRSTGCAHTSSSGVLAIPIALGQGDDLTVNFAVYQAPVAQGDAYLVPPGGILVCPPENGVLRNDTVMQGYGQQVELVDPPSHAAQFQLNPDGSFLYRPSGRRRDTFTYKITDCFGGSNVATVTIHVLGIAVPVPRGR